MSTQHPADLPDWSKSRTLATEPWKSPMHTMAERLEIADGAISFRDDVIKNLRGQLEALAQAQPSLTEARAHFESRIHEIAGALFPAMDSIKRRADGLYLRTTVEAAWRGYRAAIATQAAQPELQTVKQSLTVAQPVQAQGVPAWQKPAERLVTWLHCMSYNDSYFGEPSGYLKQTVNELRHLLPRSGLLAAAPQAAPQQAQGVQRLDDFGQPIIYDTDEIDQIAHALTGDEGEDDGVTVLHSLVKYLEVVHPGKTMIEVLTETEEARAAPQQAEPLSDEQLAVRNPYGHSRNHGSVWASGFRGAERYYGFGTKGAK